MLGGQMVTPASWLAECGVRSGDGGAGEAAAAGLGFDLVGRLMAYPRPGEAADGQQWLACASLACPRSRISRSQLVPLADRLASAAWAPGVRHAAAGTSTRQSQALERA